MSRASWLNFLTKSPASVLSPVYTVRVLTPTCMWSGALEEVQTHIPKIYFSMNYLYCIILLHCQFINNGNFFFTWPGSVITHSVGAGVGGGGWWRLSDTTIRRTWQNVNSRRRSQRIQNVKEGKRHQKKILLFLTRSYHSWILKDIGRNLLLGNRKKIAKF